MGHDNSSVLVKAPPPGVSVLMGSMSVGIFVASWLLSITSPFFLLYFISYRYWVSSLILITIAVLSFWPWEKHDVLRQVSAQLWWMALGYYKSFEIIAEGPPVEAGDAQTLYAVVPHGIFCLGWAALFAWPKMSHVRFCFSPFMYYAPVFRLVTRIMGNPGCASKGWMTDALNRGESVAIPTGGFEEASISSVDVERIFIKKRYGFIRLCLSTGVKRIRPIFVVGERKLFDNVQGMFDFRLKLNRYSIPAVLPWGLWWCPWMPKLDMDMKVVIGQPIELASFMGEDDLYTEDDGGETTPEENTRRRLKTRNAEDKTNLITKETISKKAAVQPSAESVSKCHEYFISELKRIHKEHDNDGPLEIW
eukprot:Selendium_serpulae@DN3404_c0_g1_i2.p1